MDFRDALYEILEYVGELRFFSEKFSRSPGRYYVISPVRNGDRKYNIAINHFEENNSATCFISVIEEKGETLNDDFVDTYMCEDFSDFQELVDYVKTFIDNPEECLEPMKRDCSGEEEEEDSRIILRGGF